jgi:hypothetical protein
MLKINSPKVTIKGKVFISTGIDTNNLYWTVVDIGNNKQVKFYLENQLEQGKFYSISGVVGKKRGFFNIIEQAKIMGVD